MKGIEKDPENNLLEDICSFLYKDGKGERQTPPQILSREFFGEKVKPIIEDPTAQQIYCYSHLYKDIVTSTTLDEVEKLVIQSHVLWRLGQAYLHINGDSFNARACFEASLKLLELPTLNPKNDASIRSKLLNLLSKIGRLISEDHNFSLAEEYVAEMEKIEDRFYDDESYTALLIDKLAIWNRLGDTEAISETWEGLKNSDDNISKNHRFDVILKLIESKSLPDEMYQSLLSEFDKYFNSFPDSGSNGKKLFQEPQKMHLEAQRMLAFISRGEITKAGKDDEPYKLYKSLKANFINQEPEGQSQKEVLAGINKKEGFALNDAKLVKAAIAAYKELGLDFHVAETLVEYGLSFPEDKEFVSNKDVLESWQIIESKTGESVDVIFSKNNQSYAEHSGGSFHFESDSKYLLLLNQVATLLYQRFSLNGKRSPAQAYQKALQGYDFQNGKTNLERISTYDINSPDFITAAKAHFGLSDITVVSANNGSADDIFHQVSQEATEKDETITKEWGLLEDSDSVSGYRQIIAIPIPNGPTFVFVNQSKEPLMSHEIVFLQRLFGGNIPPKLRELMIPKPAKCLWIKGELDDCYFREVDRIYMKTFAAHPDPDDDYWALLLDENNEYLAAVAIGKLNLEGPPFLFKGFRNVEDARSVLDSHNISSESCAEVGTFAPEKLLGSEAIPYLLLKIAESSQKEGFNNILMVAHKAIRHNLEALGIKYITIEPEDEKKVPHEEMLIEIGKKTNRTESEVEALDKAYISNKAVDTKTIIFSIQDILDKIPDSYRFNK